MKEIEKEVSQTPENNKAEPKPLEKLDVINASELTAGHSFHAFKFSGN